jgi:hypothetical protein
MKPCPGRGFSVCRGSGFVPASLLSFAHEFMGDPFPAKEPWPACLPACFLSCMNSWMIECSGLEEHSSRWHSCQQPSLGAFMHGRVSEPGHRPLCRDAGTGSCLPDGPPANSHPRMHSCMHACSSRRSPCAEVPACFLSCMNSWMIERSGSRRVTGYIPQPRSEKRGECA